MFCVSDSYPFWDANLRVLLNDKYGKRDRYRTEGRPMIKMFSVMRKQREYNTNGRPIYKLSVVEFRVQKSFPSSHHPMLLACTTKFRDVT